MKFRKNPHNGQESLYRCQRGAGVGINACAVTETIWKQIM